MISYTEREIFSPEHLRAYQLARHLVERLLSHTQPDGAEIRCHELARVVAHHLTAQGLQAEVVDGLLEAIQHTWILLPGPPRSILDVYTPGRVPQVQLLDDHFLISQRYLQTEPRTDIRQEVIDSLRRPLPSCPKLLSEAAQRRLVRYLMARHPLPWDLDLDWTVEVIDAHRAIVIKCMRLDEAREIVALANAIAFEEETACQEVKALFRT